ncbi:hypothetical protein ACIA6D_01335 [Streptomyces cacaoi]
MRSRPLRVGSIGPGGQGASMARRIVETGFGTTLGAGRPAALAPFAPAPRTVRGPARRRKGAHRAVRTA